MGGWRLGLSLISWITAAGVVTGSQCRLQDPPQIVALYDEQYLQYPNDSTSYPNNADCGWLLHTMYYDYVVHVTFTFLDVHASSSDCADDYVQVFDGSNSSYSLGRLCGSTVGEFYSSAKYLLITFHSDSSTTRGGFRLRYGAVASWEVPATSENKCPFKATQPIGVIAAEQFLQYPVNSVNYPDNADCGWLLEAGSNNYVVHVNFTFVDVEDSVSGCPYDYLKVFDGPNDEARSLGTFCGSRLLQFQSSLRSLYITFHSDTKGTRAGFRLTYQALGRWGEEPTADGSCSLYTPSLMAVSSADQFIQYPSSSLKDSRGGDCGWLLETDIADYVMHVNLSLVNIEAPSNSCVSDYIEVFDGSDDDAVSLGIVCGSRGHGFYSSGQSIYIRFHSNIGGSQLRLSYRAVANYKAPDEGSDVNIAGIAGGVLGGVALLAIVVATVVVVFIRQQCHLSTRNNPTNRRNNRTAV
ncbi:deleted in malignant brain tumors 1 protein-like isoform X1 [Pomacea canaliculata]|uniref:deleted in malignant brain tumors 1 protein-like isoform X1 n=1 Tax=Pomacea canaliculata TaxID=400727 RepID=UPI000D72B251|nr:deleted in malignant brain tumors 1 protein-like isoform X1 [Pomacea canaliculata]